jgi:hypothetical protein
MAIVFFTANHRVDRVPGLLSSRPNWLPPPSYPLASVAPHLLVPEGGGGDPGQNRLRERGGGSKFGRRDRQSGTLGKVQYNSSTLQTLLPQCTSFLKKDAKMEKLEIGVIFCQ